MQTEMILLSKLQPHPDNPRLFLREDIVNGICEQIKAKGFEDRHAPHVRKIGDDGFYQIVSGHQRTEGAKRAGVKKIPCVVVEMTDEEAFRELLFSNAQDDLKPLEIGLHIIKAVERGKGGRGKKGGIAEWADKMGKTRQLYSQYATAAEVALKAKPASELAGLLDYTQELAIIHRAHNSYWPAVVAAMLRDEWSKETTESRIETVRRFSIPNELAEIYIHAEVIDKYLDGYEFSPGTLDKLVEAIRRVDLLIESYRESVDVEAYRATFREWLATENRWSYRAIVQYQRSLQVELSAREEEAAQRWNHGDWRQFIAALAEESVALLLTDPPYGIEFQSDYRLDRSAEHRHEEIAADLPMEAQAEIAECFRVMYAKLTANAHVLCFCHWSQEPCVRTAIESAGFTVRGSLIWVKNNTGMGDPDTTFAPKHERIIHAVKGSPVLFRREPDVLEAARVNSQLHPNEKPVNLLTRLIEATTVEGELVADPFAGVASTLVAARRTNRAYWGCEVDKTYFSAGSERLSRER